MLRVGQKVVCVDAKNTHTLGIHELTEGQIYTVVWIGQLPPGIENLLNEYLGVGCWRKAPYYVLVAEARRLGPVPFASTRFRPVAERKTDISVFQAMLKTTKIKQDA